MKIPELHGKYGEWQGFIDIFDKIIHNNAALNDDTRIQYLKLCLKGMPASYVAHLPPTAESYKTCREILAKRYNNKREQIGKHIDAIPNLPTAKTESSEHLRKIHDTVNESILAINNLRGIAEEESDNRLDELMVIHIILK